MWQSCKVNPIETKIPGPAVTNVTRSINIASRTLNFLCEELLDAKKSKIILIGTFYRHLRTLSQSNKTFGHNSRPFLFSFYRPRSVASEGYVFTGVCHSFCSTPGVGGWGGGGEVVNTKGPGYNTPLPPRMRPGYNTPPRMRPGYNTSPPGWDQVTTPPPPRTWNLVTTPPPPPPGWDQVTTPPPPPPPTRRMRPGYNTSPPGLCAGGRYASYWNAFLFKISFFTISKLGADFVKKYSPCWRIIGREMTCNELFFNNVNFPFSKFQLKMSHLLVWQNKKNVFLDIPSQWRPTFYLDKRDNFTTGNDYNRSAQRLLSLTIQFIS